ncbi:phosphatidylinositol-glycan biosynthesis class x protein [Plakobranchus ocellatus]|uniref:Phosphatidylinositol-glycan biosynthesis class X protein n=1 Tax=Plakobranchus ocellatus TaxID=259542 RepID=A0AAV4A2W3_9GAST|nr:phosphatidylinositol-glycan biosynthesis class x protein [Plakobranchus ocellatus]
MFSKVISLLLVFLPILVHGILSKEHFVIERKLSGFGFHRDLETNIHMPSKLCEYLAATGCSLLIFQVLPSGVYADPFQLKSLEMFGFPKVLFDRNVDIEAAEYVSKPHEIFMYIDLSVYKPDQTTGHLSIEVSMPIHARYHKPLPWQADSEPRATISLLHPGVYSNCSQSDEHNTLKAPCDVSNSSLCAWSHISYISYSPQVEMSIPIGQEWHKPLVVTVTLVTTIVICALLCKTLISHRDNDIDKTS